jgi:predicted RNase H-like nuclease (RuvC/YqgF family)
VDSTVIVAIITAAGVILAGISTLLGVRFTQRQARRAQEATAALERDKVDASAYESARSTWEGHVASLRAQVAELREEAEVSRRVGRELRDRVDELETSRSSDRARIRELTDYARDLLRILAEHEITYPAPPPGLAETGR